VTPTSGNSAEPVERRKQQSALAANPGNDYLAPSLPHQIKNDFTNQTSGSPPLRPASRWLLALWSLFLIAGFTLASRLEPDPRGYGTHQSLGFPPCSIRLMFGVVCPTCGMTTSFSHFTRGQFIEAARANFAGLLLAAFCAVQIPWCWASSLQGRLWGISRPELTLAALILILISVCLAQWLVGILL
jgi:hypothetical protein